MDQKGRIQVPEDYQLRTLLLTENYNTPYAGHFGAQKTQEMTERHWVWPGLARDAREFVRSCPTCQRQKHNTHATPGFLHPILARRPWQIVTLDFVGGLPEHGPDKLTQLLVIVDKFSKYVCIEPCPTEMDAYATAQVFLKRVVRDFGVLRVVISDRGPQFTSAVWTHILKTLGSTVALASTHHPQSDGQSERAIQTLLRLLRCFAWNAMNGRGGVAGNHTTRPICHQQRPHRVRSLFPFPSLVWLFADHAGRHRLRL